MTWRQRIMWATAAAVVIGGGAAWYHLPGSEPVRPTRGAAGPIPVVAAEVTKRDLPIYLTGLGTVQASFTVGIRAQVDGKLEEVLFVEGQHVKKGDVLAKIDPRLYQAALDQAKAKKMQDEAQLISAQKDLYRSKTLVDKSFQTQQVVDQQQARVDQLIASIDADDASIEAAQTNFDYTSIKASSDGRMGVRLIDPGNIVHASDSRVHRYIGPHQAGGRAVHAVGALAQRCSRGPGAGAGGGHRLQPRQQAQARTGKLLLIDNIVDQASATMRLKAMFDNEEDQLWPGDFVNARLLVEVRHDVLTIPSPAIQRGPDGIYTWVVSKNDTVQVRKIETGPTTEIQTIITSGLAEGERVVVDGQYKLRPNVKVQVASAAQAAATPPPSERPTLAGRE